MISFAEHLIAFVFAICLLVTVHEYGHYWVARRLGFKVLRFSVGFGKPLWTRIAGADRTEYVIAPWPIGGYVKLLDEREGPVPTQDLPRSFTRRPHWQRIAVLLAGPAFNILFAIVLLAGMLFVTGVTNVRPLVGTVDAGSLMAQAGVRRGDEITAINSQPVAGQRDVLLDLLDAVSTAGAIHLQLRGTDGTLRDAEIRIPDPATRRHLTEPAALLPGLGLNFYEPKVPAVLGSVESGGPAAEAGLHPGDEIVAINGDPIGDFRQLVTHIQSHPGDNVTVRYLRAGVESSVRVNVLAEQQDGHAVGRIHVTVATPPPLPASMLRHTRLSVLAAVGHASAEAWDMTALQARMVWRMVTGGVSIKNLSGPLTIAEYAGDSAAAGVVPFISFLVLVSLALGFMNLLPIPMLDGGQIVFQAIEWLKGSPLSERFQIITQQLGVALLVLLMGVALFNDIALQFG